MQVTWHGSEIQINQANYLKKVLEHFQMTNAKLTLTPLLNNWDPKLNAGKAMAAEITHYQSIIELLLYLMIGTHPDIAFAVTNLSQFCTNPSEDHYKAALHICHYLVGTQDYTVVYSKTSDKGLYSVPIGLLIKSGNFFKLARGIICWQSYAQKSIALSSTEVEYMAISNCSRQAVWIKTLIEEIGFWLKAIPIYGDNQGLIFISSNAVQEKQIKHIDICYHYIHKLIGAKQVDLYFVPGEMNPANIFTKNLAKVKFTQFQNQMGLDFNKSKST